MKPGHLSVNMQGRAVSGPLQAMPATMTTNTLTPTTLKTITQIFESDACLDNLQRYGVESGGFQPPTVLPNPPQVNTDGAILTLTPASVESSSPGLAVITTTATAGRHWQGGSVTTVVAPARARNPLALADEEEEEEEEECHDDTKDEDYEPDVKRHAVARRSSGRTAARVAAAAATSSPVVSSSSSSADKKKVKSVAAGRSGRKPAGGRGIDEASLTPAEFKKLNVRRERNKLAAARCRNRRMDLTNKLASEVEVWEEKKKSLTQEIQELTAAKQELEFVLEAHRHTCSFSAQSQAAAAQPVMVAIKSEPLPVTAASSPVLVEPVNPVYIMETDAAAEATAAAKPRPSSLSFARQQPKAVSPKVEGVDIETPSVILPNISFDSLGLTPTTVVFNSIVTPVAPPMLNTPTCSRQYYRQSSKTGDAGTGPEYLQL